MKKVLVLDEILALIAERESFFGRSDFRIIPAASNAEALAIHNTERVNLVISKLNMPEMDGLDFCSVIRNHSELSRVSIIMLFNDNQEDIIKIQTCKANAFIRMPVDAETLLAKSEELLSIAKREYYRVLLGVKVSGKFQDLPFLCRSVNISASGMLIESDKVLLAGDVIHCAFFLPDSRKIVTDATIVRRLRKLSEYDTNQYGIKFVSLSAEEQAAIDAFVYAQMG